MTFTTKSNMRATFFGISILIALATSAGAISTNFEVDQIGLRFAKSNLNLKAGETIRFHNSDDVIHNIMTIDDDEFTEDYGLQKPGEIIKAKFEKFGTFQVRCSIHPKMKMTVAVTE